MGRATIVPLGTRSHGNVRLDSNEPAGATDNSDVPAAAMLQARSFGLAVAPVPRPRSGIAGLPARGPWPELTVASRLATGSSRSSESVVQCPLSAGIPLPCWHRQLSQAVKAQWFGWTLTQYHDLVRAGGGGGGLAAGCDGAAGARPRVAICDQGGGPAAETASGGILYDRARPLTATSCSIARQPFGGYLRGRVAATGRARVTQPHRRDGGVCRGTVLQSVHR